MTVLINHDVTRPCQQTGIQLIARPFRRFAFFANRRAGSVGTGAMNERRGQASAAGLLTRVCCRLAGLDALSGIGKAEPNDDEARILREMIAGFERGGRRK